MVTIETYVRDVITQFEHILFTHNANQILHMNIQNNLLCRRTMLRMLIAVGGYHFCNAVSKHRWIATQAFSSHWWKSCAVKMGWDQKKVTWRGGGTRMVIVTVEGPNRFAMNCHMLSWRSIDEALVVGGQWRPKTWASWALRPRPWWQKKDGRHPRAAPSASPRSMISSLWPNASFFERFWEKWLVVHSYYIILSIII